MGCCGSSSNDASSPEQVKSANQLAPGSSVSTTGGGTTDQTGTSAGNGATTTTGGSDDAPTVEIPKPAEIRPLDGSHKTQSHRTIPRRSQSAKDMPPDMNWRQKSVSVPGLVGQSMPETTFEAMKSIARDQTAPELVSPVTTPFMPESIPTLDEILPSIPNGSLILLSGSNPMSSIIKMAISKGHFTHAAVFVREKGESMDSKKDPLIFSGDSVCGLDDYFEKMEGKTTSGVHLSSLKQYIANFEKFYGKGLSIDPSQESIAAVVRLRGLPEGEFDEGRLWKEMERLNGSAYPSSVEAFTDWESDDQAFKDAGISAAFSTQLVAHTYEHLGFMADRIPPNEFVPTSFDTTADGRGDAQNCLLPTLTLEAPQFFKLTEEDMIKYRLKGTGETESKSTMSDETTETTTTTADTSSAGTGVFPDTIGGASPVQVTTDDAKSLIEQSKQCPLFFEKPIPSWWNDGRRNHDWAVLRKLLQVTYYTTGEMTSGDKDKDLEIINWPRENDVKLVSSDSKYCVWKIVEDDSFIISVCAHAVSEVKENFEELADYLHELMDEASEFADEIVMDMQVLIPKEKMSETPVVGHSEGGTVALCVAQRLKSNGIGLCPAGAGFMSEICNDNLLAVRIKNDPISAWFKPDCAMKEIDLGFTKEEGMKLKAHMPDFETLDIHA